MKNKNPLIVLGGLAIVVIIVVVCFRGCGRHQSPAVSGSGDRQLTQTYEVEKLIESSLQSPAAKQDALRSFQQTGISKVAEEHLTAVFDLPRQMNQVEQNLAQRLEQNGNKLDQKLANIEGQNRRMFADLNGRMTKVEESTKEDPDDPLAHLPVSGGGRRSVAAIRLDHEFRTQIGSIEEQTKQNTAAIGKLAEGQQQILRHLDTLTSGSTTR